MAALVVGTEALRGLEARHAVEVIDILHTREEDQDWMIEISVSRIR